MKRSSYLHATGIALGVVLAPAAVLESCVLPEFAVGSPPETDAGTDAKEEGGPVVCGATYPDPPNVQDTDIQGTYVLALRTVELGENTDHPPGFDLDGQCTCTNGAGPTCTGTLQPCDAPNGVDNAMARLMAFINNQPIGGVNVFSSSYVSSKAEAGQWSAILEITGYNGLKNDPDVGVTLYVSPGFGGLDGGVPLWTGSDAWPISESSYADVDAGTPRYKSAGAYVTNYVLVAALPAAGLQISGGTETITINITGGVIVGTLKLIAGQLKLTDGTIAGRWRDADVFKALSSYRSNGGDPICKGDSFGVYNAAKTAVCSSRDILADGTGSKSLPCDSLSLGIGFTADPAKLGEVRPAADAGAGCPDASDDPANDSCEATP